VVDLIKAAEVKHDCLAEGHTLKRSDITQHLTRRQLTQKSFAMKKA